MATGLSMLVVKGSEKMWIEMAMAQSTLKVDLVTLGSYFVFRKLT